MIGFSNTKAILKCYALKLQRHFNFMNHKKMATYFFSIESKQNDEKQINNVGYYIQCETIIDFYR